MQGVKERVSNEIIIIIGFRMKLASTTTFKWNHHQRHQLSNEIIIIIDFRMSQWSDWFWVYFCSSAVIVCVLFLGGEFPSLLFIRFWFILGLVIFYATFLIAMNDSNSKAYSWPHVHICRCSNEYMQVLEWIYAGASLKAI